MKDHVIMEAWRREIPFGRSTHGRTGTITYELWVRMRAAAKKRQEPVHAPWKRFTVFLRDMGKAPAGAKLKRLDASRPWEPGNVTYETPDPSTNLSLGDLRRIARESLADSPTRRLP